jgi:hypothetical protein
MVMTTKSTSLSESGVDLSMDNKFFLVYYSRTNGGVDDDGNSVEIDHRSVAAYAKSIKPPKGRISVFCRFAEVWDGQPEEMGGRLPTGVVLIGDGESLVAVRKIYEALDVSVEEGDLGDEEIASGIEASGEGKTPFNGDLDLLKQRATELSVTFSPSIKFDTLLERVQDAEAK